MAPYVKRLFMPVVFFCVFVAVFYVSRPQLEQLPFPHQKSHTSNGIDAEAAAAAVESVAESADLTYPLFDYTYDKIATMTAEKKLSKDPCIDVMLPDGGADSRPGEGQLALVTGGAGFIGSNLVDRLLELGYKVRIFDNLYTGFLRNVPLDNHDVDFILGDILDQKALDKAVEGVDYVFHLAAMSKVVPSLKSSDMARFCTETNALGSWNVLDAARKKGNVKKVIYAASSTYYGNRPAPHFEDMAADFLTPYAASKFEGEIQMQMFDRLFSVPTVSTRFFMVYGPRQPSTGAYAIVTGVFAKQAAEQQPLTIEGDGTHFRDFIHVSDIVEGLILSQQNPNLRGDVVNLGSGSAFSVQDVANLVSSNQMHVDPRPNDLEGTLADTCKMKRLLNYKAKADFKTEMTFMAQQTMEGNVFMQSWLSPMHALSAPHLLAPDTPVFSWPKTYDDIDALLLALKHVELSTLAEDEAESRRISVITLSSKGDDTEARTDLLLNTVFSLVRFGHVKQYIVAATDEDALDNCIALNLPCFDATYISAPTLLNILVVRGLDVHLAQLGNSYVSEITKSLDRLSAAHGNADVLGANPQGDIFVRANDRTRAAMGAWSQTHEDVMSGAAGSDILYNLNQWPALDFQKEFFEVERQCEASWAGVTGQTASTDSAKPSVDPQTSSEDVSTPTVSLKSAASAVPISRVSRRGKPKGNSLCDKNFYRAVGCEDAASIGPTAEVVKSLKATNSWHLTECMDSAHCDRQQTVPTRWVSQPPDLELWGGIC